MVRRRLILPEFRRRLPSNTGKIRELLRLQFGVRREESCLRTPGHLKKWHEATSLQEWTVDLAEDGRPDVWQHVSCVGSIARHVDRVVGSQLDHLYSCIFTFSSLAVIL